MESISYVAIGIVIVIVCTAFYIGRLLYKERVRKDLESSGGIQKPERVLELEPLPYKTKESSQEILQSLNSQASSLENSSITLLQETERKSSSNINSINSKRNAKSLNKVRNGSSIDSSSANSKRNAKSLNKIRNGSSIDSNSANSKRNAKSLNKIRNGSSIDSSSANSKRNAKSLNKIRNSSIDSRYGSRSVSSVNSSLVIKIPKDMPPPPPPSPLKPRDDSIDSFLIIMPSDISESTRTAINMSSNASSPILSQSKSDLKAQSLIPTSHDNHEFV